MRHTKLPLVTEDEWFTCIVPIDRVVLCGVVRVGHPGVRLTSGRAGWQPSARVQRIAGYLQAESLKTINISLNPSLKKTTLAEF